MSSSGVQKRREQLLKQQSGRSRGGRPLSRKTLTQKQKITRWAIYAGVAVLLILIVIAACTPRKGTMLYGVCLVFTERILTYPTTLQVNYVEQYPMAVRIGFSHTDTFGQFKTEMIECTYRPDAEMGLAMDSVLLNRKEMDGELVSRFNAGLPMIVKNPPDLTLPPPMPEELVDMKK